MMTKITLFFTKKLYKQELVLNLAGLFQQHHEPVERKIAVVVQAFPEAIAQTSKRLT